MPEGRHVDTYLDIYIHIMQTPEEKEEAERALAKYDVLTDYADRQRFLKSFEEHGGGTGKDALKFVSSFKKSLEFNDTTTLGQVEDYYTVGEILTFNGSALSNFKKVSDAVSDALPVSGEEEHG